MGPRELLKFLAPLRLRVAQLVERAVVKVVNDQLKMQGLQVAILADEVRDGVERFQEYGFTSNPHPEAEAIVVSLGGTRNRAAVIAVDDRRYRLKNLASGEVALYTDEGDKIHFKRGRVIDVVAGAELKVTAPIVTANAETKIEATSPLVKIIAATKVEMTTPLVEMSGNLVVTGNITGANVTAVTNVADQNGAKTMAGMRSTYNAHTHPENGTGGGTTSAPNQSMG